MCCRLADPVHGSHMFRNKAGNFLHILSGYEQLKIVSTGHKAQRFYMPEPRQTLCNPVIPKVAFWTHFQFNDRRDFSVACFFPVDDGSIFTDYSCGLECVDP